MREHKGQSLIELIFAVALFALFASALASYSLGGFAGLRSGEDFLEAEHIAREGIEAVQSIIDRAWNENTYSQSGLTLTANYWNFSGEGTQDVIGDFTRVISFEDVCRDGNDDITACPGLYTDPHTKEITATVTWENTVGTINTYEQQAYVSNWESEYWTQTDWSGGSGQSIWSDDTRYETDDGNIDTTTSGQVELAAASSVGCVDTTWEFDVPGDYSYDTDKIEVVSSLAQLKEKASITESSEDSGFDSIESSVSWPFDTPSNYSYDSGKISVTSGKASLIGTGGALGASTNPGFDSGTSSWSFATWDVGGGEPTPTGSWQSSGGDPGGWVNISVPSGNNDEVGGYWSQSVTTTISNPDTASLSYDWQITNFESGANSITLYLFVDSAAGAPTIGTQVWSQTITSTNGWSGVGSVDVSSSLGAAGTYYIKAALWVDTGGGKKRGPYTAGFDNLELTYESGATYPSDVPTIQPTTSYTAPSTMTSWDTFIEDATKDGGEIYYQLSDDDGSTWQYWDGASWATAGANDYNTATQINTNISSFPIASKKILFKAFLESDGTQHVQLDDIQIDFTTPVAWTYADWDQGGGEVDVTGSSFSSGGNPGNYVSVDFPEGGNDELGGYWEQSYTTTITNQTSATLDLNYRIQSFDAGVDIAELYVFIDSTSGAPTIGTQVWNHTVTTTTGWVSVSDIDISAAITGAGTYYIKVAAWIETPGGPGTGPFEFDFDNVLVEVEGTVGDPYYDDGPSIAPTSSYTPPTADAWVGFVEGATKNGGEVYYQLSDDNGATWYYWDTSDWVVAGSTDYNTATVVNDEIHNFDTSNNSIVFKAFLVSDGTQHVQLDSVTIQCDNLQLEVGSVSTDENWVTVNLQNTYDDPVVVASYNEFNNTLPASVRIRNVIADSFDIRIHNPGDSNIESDTLHYFVVEKGTWNIDGVQIEAGTHTTSTIGYKSNWTGDSITFQKTFTNPIVMHQVTSTNDTNWITSFVSSNGSRTSPPSGTGMWLALNGAEAETSHAAEDIDYLIIEGNENGTFDGINFETTKTGDSINGHNVCEPYTFFFSYSSIPIGFVTQLEIDGNDGGWLVACDTTTTSSIGLHVEEDQENDNERNHTTETAGFIIFETTFSFSNQPDANMYETFGTFQSSAFDTSYVDANFEIIEWDADLSTCTPNCSIQTQIRVAPDASGSPGTWSSWYGVSGVGTYFTEAFGTLLPIAVNGNQWIQYRVELLGDGSATPILQEVRVNYQ